MNTAENVSVKNKVKSVIFFKKSNDRLGHNFQVLITLPSCEKSHALESSQSISRCLS